MNSDPLPQASPDRSLPNRRFCQAVVATRYLLGARSEGLSEGLTLSDDSCRQAVGQEVLRLSRGLREERAKFLARQVTRIVRSLRAQRLR